MSIEYNGSNSAQSLPDVSGIDDYTVAFICHPVSNTTNKNVFAWDNYPSTPRNELTYKPSAVSGVKSLFGASRDAGGTIGGLGVLSAGVDHTIIVTRSGTTVTCYEDGSSLGTITVGTGSFTAENIRFGCHFFSASNNEFANARMSEVAIWSVVLDASQRASYDKFISPRLIAPASLLRYVENIRESRDLIIGDSVSDIGSPSVAVHPPVIRPAAQILQFPSAVGAPVVLGRHAIDGGMNPVQGGMQ